MKKIIRRQLDQTLAHQLHNLHPVLQKIYRQRNLIDQTELDTSLHRLLPWTDLLGIDTATTLIADAIMQHHRIIIIGDFDADGATSTAVAVRSLRSFGAVVNYAVPNRFTYGYGLTPELVQAVVATYQPDLIITVDNGIANHAGVDEAISFGIKVIITDHHLAAASLPRAHAIVNPNQPHDQFASKNLAGVGVIFYVMVALRHKLIARKWFQATAAPNLAQWLDIVALGTVADVVMLDQNNRILVAQGIARIRNRQAVPGILALLELGGRNYKHTVASDLGFAVGARLNAAGRLDNMAHGIECLLCDDTQQAASMARALDQFNDERKHIEQDMQAQALTIIQNLASPTASTTHSLCLFDEGWHQGVIGILAARIKERFNRPTIIFAAGNADEIKGSARSISGFHIRDALALIDAQNPGLIIKFGGHAMAAGLTILKSNLTQFIDAFEAIARTRLSDEQLLHSIVSDGSLAPNEYNLELAYLLRDGGPWGQGFPEPLFDDVFEIIDQRIVGSKHLKLKLKLDTKILAGIAFFIDLTLWPNYNCRFVRAAYRLDINNYQNWQNLQLIVEYLEPIPEDSYCSAHQQARLQAVAVP